MPATILAHLYLRPQIPVEEHGNNYAGTALSHWEQHDLNSCEFRALPTAVDVDVDFIYPDLSQSRDMQATTTMSEQFGLLYNEPLLKCEIVASLGPVRPSLLTCRYVPLRCSRTKPLRLFCKFNHCFQNGSVDRPLRYFPPCVLLPASKHPSDAVEAVTDFRSQFFSYLT